MNEWAKFLIVVFIIFVIIFLLWDYKNRKLFYPVKNHIWEPPYEYENIYINGKHGWYFKSFKGRITVIYCHGNTGNVSHRDYIIELCHRLKFNLLIFDYSGFGYSSGHPDIQTICNDGDLFYNYLRANGVEADDIVVWGESLGGAVAIWIAANNPCKCLLLLSTFTTIQDIATHDASAMYKMGMGVFFHMTNDFNNTELIAKVKCPIVQLHSKEDDIIPYPISQKLRASIKSKHLFIEIKNRHSTPHITVQNLKDMFNFVCVDSSKCYLVEDILKEIENFYDKHILTVGSISSFSQ